MAIDTDLPSGLQTDEPLPPQLARHPAMQALLQGQHAVRRLLRRQADLRNGDAAGADDTRRHLVRRLCTELVVHMHVQEELLYPRLRRLVDDTLPIDQSEAEHQCLRDLAERLVAMAPSDPLFEARLQVLAEIFDLHVRREVREVYPLMQGRALRNLGQALQCRRDELLMAVDLRDGTPPENEEADPVGEPPR